MGTQETVRMLDRLLGLVTTDGPLMVMPVLARNLSANLDLFAAVVRNAGGTLLVAEDIADGLEGTADANLAATIDTALGPEIGSIALEQDGDIVRALLDGSSASASTNAGARSLLGSIGSLFSTQLRGSRLAAIAYDETALDSSAAAELWQLLTTQLSGTTVLGEVRCLVLFVGVSAIDYERHCRPPFGARFRLSDAGFAQRHDWDQDRASIHRLKPPSEVPFVFFLGAGFSASSDLPLGNELRDWALVKLVGADGEPSLDDLVGRFIAMVRDQDRAIPGEDFSDFERYRDDLTLERVLREERQLHEAQDMPTIRHFAERNARAGEGPGPAVRAIARLLESAPAGARVVIATVNFDTLIERSIEGLEIFASDEDFDRFPDYLAGFIAGNGAVPLLKLHGTIDQPETILANVDETMAGLSVSRTSALDAFAKHEQIPFIYVGYSMRDLDIGPVLGQPRFAAALDEVWVSPFPEPTVERFAGTHRQDAWRERGLRAQTYTRTITQTADKFMTELVESWRTQ